MLFLFLQSGVAQAGGSATAEALFRAGRQAAQAGEHRAACARFRESHRLDPAPGTLLNIAVCEEQLGEITEAWQHYQQVIDSVARSDGRARLASSLRKKVAPRLPWLTVNAAPGAPDGLQLKLGDQTLGGASLGVALPVNPGHYDLVVSAPGYSPRRYAVSLVEGQRVEIEVVPGDPLPAASETELATGAGDSAPSAPPSVSDTPVSAYVLIAAGGVGVLVGLVGGVLAWDRSSRVEEACPGGSCESQQHDEAQGYQEESKDWMLVGAVAGGLGVISVGTGLYLWSGDSGDGTSAILSPVVASDNWGAALQGRF